MRFLLSFAASIVCVGLALAGCAEGDDSSGDSDADSDSDGDSDGDGDSDM